MKQHMIKVWLFGWLVGWLAGWLVGWLVGWLFNGTCNSDVFHLCRQRTIRRHIGAEVTMHLYLLLSQLGSTLQLRLGWPSAYHIKAVTTCSKRCSDADLPTGTWGGSMSHHDCSSYTGCLYAGELCSNSVRWCNRYIQRGAQSSWTTSLRQSPIARHAPAWCHLHHSTATYQVREWTCSIESIAETSPIVFFKLPLLTFLIPCFPVTMFLFSRFPHVLLVMYCNNYTYSAQYYINRCDCILRQTDNAMRIILLHFTGQMNQQKDSVLRHSCSTNTRQQTTDTNLLIIISSVLTFSSTPVLSALLDSTVSDVTQSFCFKFSVAVPVISSTMTSSSMKVTHCQHVRTNLSIAGIQRKNKYNEKMFKWHLQFRKSTTKLSWLVGCLFV